MVRLSLIHNALSHRERNFHFRMPADEIQDGAIDELGAPPIGRMPSFDDDHDFVVEDALRVLFFSAGYRFPASSIILYAPWSSLNSARYTGMNLSPGLGL